MGGLGSGNRYRWGQRDTVEESLRFDVRSLYRWGWLAPGGASVYWYRWTRGDDPAGDIRVIVERRADDEPAALRLVYRSRTGGNEWRDVNDRVQLDFTPCHYGGRRPWLLCPGCGRRVAVLYGGALFRCRRCTNLTYSSTREAGFHRIDTKCRNFRRRMGDVGAGRGMAVDWQPNKPRGMHWRTWAAALDEWRRLQAEWYRVWTDDMERLSGLLGNTGRR